MIIGLASVLVVGVVSSCSSDRQALQTKVTAATTEVSDELIPGKGMGELTLGMEFSKVVDVLGPQPKSDKNETDERAELEKWGYTPDNWIPFKKHFDRVYMYNDEITAKYPVFKIFVKDDKVCGMILSTQNKCATNPLTKDGVGLKATKDKLLKVMGEPTRKVPMEHYDSEYFYDDKGISFVVDDQGLVCSLDVFPPMNK